MNAATARILGWVVFIALLVILWSAVIRPVAANIIGWGQVAAQNTGGTVGSIGDAIVPPPPTRGPASMFTATPVVATAPNPQAGGSTSGYTTEELIRAINEGSVVRIPFTPTPIPTPTSRPPMIIIPGDVQAPCIYPCANTGQRPPQQATPSTTNPTAQPPNNPCAGCPTVCNQPGVVCIQRP